MRRHVDSLKVFCCLDMPLANRLRICGSEAPASVVRKKSMEEIVAYAVPTLGPRHKNCSNLFIGVVGWNLLAFRRQSSRGVPEALLPPTWRADPLHGSGALGERSPSLR